MNFILLFVSSIYFKRLKFMIYRITKLLNMYFIYKINGKFCKFFFFSFYSLVYFLGSGGGHFSLLKSPHVNKKAQSQFSSNNYKGVLTFQISYVSFYHYYFLIFLFKILRIKYNVCYKFKYKCKNSYFFYT